MVVHVQPRAKRNEVLGWYGDAIKIRISAPPVDGAANDELVRFLATRLDIARSSIQIVSGTGARRKRLRIEGLSGHEVAERLGVA